MKGRKVAFSRLCDEIPLPESLEEETFIVIKIVKKKKEK